MKKIFFFCIFSFCFLYSFPKYKNFVNDFANIVNEEYENKIISLCYELEQKTTAEIAVVTISTIYPDDENTYAVKLFQEWGIGKKGKDNGILILLALKERKIKIEVGYGLEGILPDGLCGEILDNVTPYLKNREFGIGLYLCSSFIAKIIADNEKVTLSNLSEQKMESQQKKPLVSIIPIIIFLLLCSSRFFWPFLFLCGSGYRGGGYWSNGSGGFSNFGGGFSGGGGASRGF